MIKLIPSKRIKPKRIRCQFSKREQRRQALDKKREIAAAIL